MSTSHNSTKPKMSRAALADGYAQCAGTARRAASNFYLTFWLLPRAKRLATCALYAFFRRADDIADTPGAASDRRRALDGYRTALDSALAGDGSDLQLLALADTVRTFAIPREILYDALDGVAMDIVEGNNAANGSVSSPSPPVIMESVADLQAYCYRVASVVGLACIHVCGFHDTAAIAHATQCGYAFQWTNILRDLGEDARNGRYYLPGEVMRSHHCTTADVMRLAHHSNQTKTNGHDEIECRIARLLNAESQRARQYFAAAEPLLPLLSADGRRIFSAMFRTYRELLTRVERASTGVFARRVRVPTWRKLQFAATSLVGARMVAPLHFASERLGQ